MNTETLRGRRIPKRPRLSSSANDSLPRDSLKKIFSSDDLRHRWEQIVTKDRS